jgi:uncharacterized membrane protein YdjX (TVP38/TMEM64 family)
VRVAHGRYSIIRWAVGLAAFAAVYGGTLLLLRRLDLQNAVADVAERAGWWGVLLYLALMAAAVMSPLPDAPVALAGLVAYGPLPGMTLVVGGSWLGAALNFFLVRALGREAFRQHFPRLAAPIDDLAERLGFELLVLLRVLPTVTFDIASYAAAVTNIPFARFAGATLFGQLPGPTIAALVGAHTGGADGRVTVALWGLALTLAVALLAWRWLRARRRSGGGA